MGHATPMHGPGAVCDLQSVLSHSLPPLPRLPSPTSPDTGTHCVRVTAVPIDGAAAEPLPSPNARRQALPLARIRCYSRCE